uniref:Uncharacterized protein n=1 Tax=Glossina palpalis gambiensis TaxID=67801 RepID=A0A1B0BSK5_9MUSC
MTTGGQYFYDYHALLLESVPYHRCKNFDEFCHSSNIEESIYPRAILQVIPSNPYGKRNVLTLIDFDNKTRPGHTLHVLVVLLTLDGIVSIIKQQLLQCTKRLFSRNTLR